MCCNGNSVTKLIVSQTSFTSCKTSNQYAGAIYYNNGAGVQCIISKICSFQCASTFSSAGSSRGQFAYIIIKDDIWSINQINDSSIARSRNESTTSEEALCLNRGKITVSLVNLTNNKCARYTALYCIPYRILGKAQSYITCNISYTFIVNNTAIGYSCICLDYPESSQCIDTCNIINNEQSSTTGAMIRTSAQLYIKSSCIIGNNKGKLLLDEAFSECNIILTNSTFDNDVKTSSRYTS